MSDLIRKRVIFIWKRSVSKKKHTEENNQKQRPIFATTAWYNKAWIVSNRMTLCVSFKYLFIDMNYGDLHFFVSKTIITFRSRKNLWRGHLAMNFLWISFSTHFIHFDPPMIELDSIRISNRCNVEKIKEMPKRPNGQAILNEHRKPKGSFWVFESFFMNHPKWPN